MRDLLVMYRMYGNEIAGVLNEKGVRPRKGEEEYVALALIIGMPPEPPIAGSITWNGERWDVQEDVAMGEPIHGSIPKS